jgi:hypothetical protein
MKSGIWNELLYANDDGDWLAVSLQYTVQGPPA